MHEDVKHVLDLGVDGIQVATRFIPTEECDADIRLKESLIHATKDDIAIVKSPVGMPGRAIMNPFMQSTSWPVKKSRTVPATTALPNVLPARSLTALQTS